MFYGSTLKLGLGLVDTFVILTPLLSTFLKLSLLHSWNKEETPLFLIQSITNTEIRHFTRLLKDGYSLVNDHQKEDSS